MLTGTSEAGKTARRIRGDLDTVVLKALKKDPRQRYATAQAFADDLRRDLANGAAINANQASGRAQVSAIAAARERDRALAELDLAEAMSGLIIGDSSDGRVVLCLRGHGRHGVMLG